MEEELSSRGEDEKIQRLRPRRRKRISGGRRLDESAAALVSEDASGLEEVRRYKNT